MALGIRLTKFRQNYPKFLYSSSVDKNLESPRAGLRKPGQGCGGNHETTHTYLVIVSSVLAAQSGWFDKSFCWDCLRYRAKK